LSNICCIINWNPLNSSTKFWTLLVIFACNDGGFFFGASSDPVGNREKKFPPRKDGSRYQLFTNWITRNEDGRNLGENSAAKGLRSKNRIG
jgi:hypothetical protein